MMLCESCQQSDATVHIQEIVGTEARALHLCGECAAKRGLPVDDPDKLGLASLLYKLAAEAVGVEGEGEGGAEDLSCPECGLEQGDFRRSGRLGCGGCYGAFAGLVEASLSDLHRGTRHTGKVPGRVPRPKTAGTQESGYARLREELARAVAAEAYERAAELRDEIERLRDRRENAPAR